MALDCGVDAEHFWGMSLREILAAVESHGRREKLRGDEFVAETKQTAGLLYRHAQLVAMATWNGKKFPKTLEAAFPGLFGDATSEDAPATVPIWKKQQAGMAAWVEAYNDRVRRQKGLTKNGSSTDAGNPG